VKSIAETEKLIGSETTLAASFYDSCKNDRYNPCGLTSSGEVFSPDEPNNAASPIYPDGTKLLVWSPVTKEALVLRVNNAGPYWGDRKLDVSRAAAERLGFNGVANLKVRVLDAPNSEEATYSKGRHYEPVPGYIGRYASIEEATTATASVAALEALSTVVQQPIPRETIAAARDELVGSSRAVMLAKANEAPAPQLAKQKKSAPVRTATASLGLPVISEIIQVTDAIFGIDTTATKASSGQRRVARTVTAEVRNADRTRTARVRVTAAKPKQDVRRNRKVVANLQSRRATKVQPITSDGPNDFSVFSRHTVVGSERYVSRAQQRQAIAGRSSRRTS
jgi:rare lipoprotein A